MASQFESLPDNAVFKICQRLIRQGIDIDNYDELFDAVIEIGTLFKINAQYEDYSYIKNYLKMNYDSIVNNDQSSIEKPTLSVYRIPYYIVESLVQRTEYVQDINSYDDNPNDMANVLTQLEYDGNFNIWDGLDNPERDTDIIDSEFSEWKIRSNEIRKRNY
jgi:hypothetical protein